MCAKNRGGVYFDYKTGRFDMAKLQRAMGPWSSGERIMASLALALWGHRPKRMTDGFDVYRASVTLSHENLMYCLEAIAMRAGLLPLYGRLTPLEPESS